MGRVRFRGRDNVRTVLLIQAGLCLTWQNHSNHTVCDCICKRCIREGVWCNQHHILVKLKIAAIKNFFNREF